MNSHRLRNFLQYLFAVPAASITRAAWLIMAASIVSRVLGLFRDRVLASQFGAGDSLDVYYAAFRIPDFLYNLVIVGALSAGFIPVFIAARRSAENNGDQEAHWRMTNAFLTLAGVALIVFAVLFYFLIPVFAPFLAPGFSDGKLASMVVQTRIMMLSPLLLGASGILGAVLQAYRRFFIYSLAPIFYNVGIIIGALFFVPYAGLPGLAWGVVLGACLHFALQIFATQALGWRFHFRWEPSHESIREIARLMVPRTLSLGAQQINLVLLTVVASWLSNGSLSVFNFAVNLYFVPVAIFGISYALASFPSLAERAEQGDREGFRIFFSSAARQILLFVIPATVLYVLLRAQLVRVLLGSGAFDWTATVLTFETLRWLSLSLFAQSLLPLVVRSFYAHRNTMTPFLIGVVGDIATIGAALYLAPRYGVVGLGVAFSCGAILQLVGLWSGLRRLAQGLDERRILSSVARFSLAALVMALAVQGVKTQIGNVVGTETFLEVAFQGTSAAFAGIIMYAVVLWLVRAPEFQDLLLAFRRRLQPIALTSESLEEGENL